MFLFPRSRGHFTGKEKAGKLEIFISSSSSRVEEGCCKRLRAIGS
jgi:hypothetical protein